MSRAPVRIVGAGRGWFLTLLLLFPLLFLFARLDPPTQSADCLRRVSVGQAHFIHVCDSYSITSEMENLEDYFTKPNAWRGRPVYILAASGLASAVSPLAAVFKATVLNGRLNGDFNQSEFQRRFPSYFALGLLNFLVLAAALALALHLGGHDGKAAALGLSAVVASSDLMHSLFWSQHPSFLNILVPLGAAWFFVEGACAAVHDRRRMVWLGLVQALAVLDYAYAAIWMPAFLLGCGYGWLRGRQSGGLAGKLALVLLLGFGPYLGWLLINLLWLKVSISFEADAYRQFVWIIDAAKDGTLAAAFAAKARMFLPYVVASQGPAGGFAIAALLLLGWLGRRDLRTAVTDPLLLGALVAILGMLSFNFLQGYYQPRLIHGLTIALFLLVCRLGQVTGQAKTAATLLFAGTALQLALAFAANPVSLS